MRLVFSPIAVAFLAMASATVAAPVPATPQVHPVATHYPIFIVRHMQKDEGADPSLTAEGAANAELLAAMLKGKGIAVIFATPTRRAMETAAPLAKLLGIPVTPYDPAEFGLLATRAAAAGGPVLIVGHSNTVPYIIEYFGAARPGPIGDNDYGTVFDVEPGGRVTTVPIR